MTTLQSYLENRRSALSMTLEEPGPSDDQVRTMLTIAARVPDHGKVAPWRFELWRSIFRQVLHDRLSAMIDTSRPDAGKVQAGTDKLLHAPCMVAVISTAGPHETIPVWEQHLSAGASCMLLLEAANAFGFEAQWLTAWYIYDEEAATLLGLNPGEQVAGFIHIGSSTAAKTDRPRPDIADLFSIREG